MLHCISSRGARFGIVSTHIVDKNSLSCNFLTYEEKRPAAHPAQAARQPPNPVIILFDVLQLSQRSQRSQARQLSQAKPARPGQPGKARQSLAKPGQTSPSHSIQARPASQPSPARHLRISIDSSTDGWSIRRPASSQPASQPAARRTSV